MEEVDQIIFPILKDIGCVLPESVTGIKTLDSDSFYLCCAQSLNVLNPSVYHYPLKIPEGKAARFRVSSALANDLRDLGFTGEMGYETFLYPNEADMRKLLIFLIDKLPKHEQGDALTHAAAGMGSAAVVGKMMNDALRQWTHKRWHPLTKRADKVSGLESIRFSLPLAASGKDSNADIKRYYEIFQRPVSVQANEFHRFAPSIFEVNAQEVLITAEQQNEWARDSDGKLSSLRAEALTSLLSDAFRAQRGRDGDLSGTGGGRNGSGKDDHRSAFSRRADFEEEKEQTAAAAESSGAEAAKEKSDEEIKAEREKQLAELNQALEDLIAQRRALDLKLDQSASSSRQLESDLSNSANTTSQLEDAYKLKKHTIALLPEWQKNMAQLQALVDATSKRLVDLAAEWEQHRAPLVAKYRRQKQLLAERKAGVVKKVELIKRMRDEMREKANELREKEKLHKQVADELAQLPKSINRQVYVKRIMDIMKNIEKQKEEMKKILVDVRRVQKEINLVSESSKRSFALADEVIFQFAKRNPKDDHATKAYKYVVAMRSGFVELVKMVEDTGKMANDIRDVQQQMDDLESRNTQLNMERILNDLAQVKKENKTLTTKIKERRK